MNTTTKALYPSRRQLALNCAYANGATSDEAQHLAELAVNDRSPIWFENVAGRASLKTFRRLGEAATDVFFATKDQALKAGGDTWQAWLASVGCKY
jgi:hypothetical protein